MKQLTSYNRVAGYLNKIFDLLNAEYFENELSRKINEASAVVVIIGKEANKYHPDWQLIGYRNWQNYEIAKAKQLGKKIIAVQIEQPTLEGMIVRFFLFYGYAERMHNWCIFKYLQQTSRLRCKIHAARKVYYRYQCDVLTHLDSLHYDSSHHNDVTK